MDVGIVVGLGLMVTALVASGVAIYFAWKGMARPSWTNIPGFKSRFAGPGSGKVTPEHMALCLQYMLAMIRENTKLDPDTVNSILAKTDFWVMDVEKWTDSWGRTVAGETFQFTPVVNQSLASLCHEFLHVVEFGLTANTDLAHGSWTANGYYRAADAFEAWVTK